MYLTLIAFLTFLPVAVSEHRSSPPSTQFLPAAVHHTAFPYGFQPDPNPPDSSLPKGSGVDEEFANRVRNRKAQEILQQEIEEKFIQLYGESVSMDAKCTSSDPGNQQWVDPLPVPFDANTTDLTVLEDHTLREIVRDAIKLRKRTENADQLSSELVHGVELVHDAPTKGVEGETLHNQTEIDLVAENLVLPSGAGGKQDGIAMGEKIELNLTQVVEEQQNQARDRDASNVLEVVEIE